MALKALAAACVWPMPAKPPRYKVALDAWLGPCARKSCRSFIRPWADPRLL